MAHARPADTTMDSSCCSDVSGIYSLYDASAARRSVQSDGSLWVSRTARGMVHHYTHLYSRSDHCASVGAQCALVGLPITGRER